MINTSNNRQCGGCTACCSAIAIDDRHLKKPRWTACIYQRSYGCDIHATKPRACASYHCAWLLGEVGTDAQRPDVLGLVPAWGKRESSRAPATLMLVAVHKGGSCTPLAQKFIEDRLDAGLLVYVHDRGLFHRLVIHAKRGTASEPIGMHKQNDGQHVVWHGADQLLADVTKNARKA